VSELFPTDEERALNNKGRAGFFVDVFLEGLPEHVAQLIRHPGGRVLNNDDLVAERTLAGNG